MKMRRKTTGPVVYRRRTARIRSHSVVRRYFPCLPQTTGSSDTDSEYDTQLSASLLDHQHPQPNEPLTDDVPSEDTTRTLNCEPLTNSPSSEGLLPAEPAAVELPQLAGGTSEHLLMPLFRGRQQRWYASFGQYDNLVSNSTNAATRVPTPANSDTSYIATSDVDELLNVDNLFMSLFDNCSPGVAADADDDVVQSVTPSASREADEVMTFRDADDSTEAATIQRRRDITYPTSHTRLDVAESRPASDSGSEVNHSAATSDRLSGSSISSRTSSECTVRHYYDERFRPGGVLSAVRFGRNLSFVCPPAYEEVAHCTTADAEAPFHSEPQQAPPPPYNMLWNEPPSYSDVINENRQPVVVTSSATTHNGAAILPTICCTPFNGRPAVRWNRNSRVESWASSVNWITTS